MRLVAGTDEVFFGNFRRTKNAQTAEDFSVPQPSFRPKSVSYFYSSSMEPTEVRAYSNIGSGHYHFPLISNRANFSTSIVYILAWALKLFMKTKFGYPTFNTMTQPKQFFLLIA